MSFIPKPYEIYKHFKGNLYQILALAEHSETGEQLVIYQALYGSFRIYARPLSMFIEKVDRSKYPEAAQEFRFVLQHLPPQEVTSQGEAPQEVTTRGEASQEVTAQGKAPQEVTAQGEASQEVTAQGKASQEVTTRGEASQEVTARGEASQEPITQAVLPQEEAGVDAEQALDPLVVEFMDADSYEERLNILTALHHRITDEMITTMAIVSDVEVNEGTLEERYTSLRNCLLTRDRYECNRLH